MNIKARNILFVVSFFLVLVTTAQAQVSEMKKSCDKFLTSPFISDGQEYKTLLNQDELGEFRVVFYGGSTYRIVACGGSENNIIFTVYDQDKNELFSNRNRANTPYWDFKFTSTMTCTIETQLPESMQSGFAMLLIGFKQ